MVHAAPAHLDPTTHGSVRPANLRRPLPLWVGPYRRSLASPMPHVRPPNRLSRVFLCCSVKPCTAQAHLRHHGQAGDEGVAQLAAPQRPDVLLDNLIHAAGTVIISS